MSRWYVYFVCGLVTGERFFFERNNRGWLWLVDGWANYRFVKFEVKFRDLIQLSATEAVGRMCMQLLHLRAWSLVCWSMRSGVCLLLLGFWMSFNPFWRSHRNAMVVMQIVVAPHHRFLCFDEPWPCSRSLFGRNFYVDECWVHNCAVRLIRLPQI